MKKIQVTRFNIYGYVIGDRTFVSNLTAHHGEFKFELFFSHNRQKHAQNSRYHVHLNELRIKNPFPFHLSCYLRKQRARNLNKTHLFLFILATVGRHIVCVQSTRNSRENCKRFPGCNRYRLPYGRSATRRVLERDDVGEEFSSRKETLVTIRK